MKLSVASIEQNYNYSILWLKSVQRKVAKYDSIYTVTINKCEEDGVCYIDLVDGIGDEYKTIEADLKHLNDEGLIAELKPILYKECLFELV